LPSLEHEFGNTLSRILKSREAFVATSAPRTFAREGVSRTIFVDFVAQPIFADDGNLDAIFVEGHDVTDKVATEQRLELVAQELDHRVNNLLSVVEAIVMLSEGVNTTSLKQNLLGRIAALGNAHRLLSKSRWHEADLQRLLEEEMRPYTLGAPERVRLSGPTTSLSPAEAQAFAMAFHELATNAAKYGALSTPGGQVEVTWEQDATGARRVNWRERGGPVVETPSRKGVGTSVLERALRSLGGSTRQLWRPEGLVCEFELPPQQVEDKPR
jgi:two-component sensor histidine kinase